MKRLAIFLLPCILVACSNEDSPPLPRPTNLTNPGKPKPTR